LRRKLFDRLESTKPAPPVINTFLIPVLRYDRSVQTVNGTALLVLPFAVIVMFYRPVVAEPGIWNAASVLFRVL
jgi:hypothetical protein